MTITEEQLKTWSNQGATAGSAATYTSIKAALDSYSWPAGLTYDVYLQGSYANTTNIRGNSDVDVVVEMTSTFYSDLTAEEFRQRAISPATYTYTAFRAHLIAALRDYYGAALVDSSGAKSVVVLPASGRLKADVVPACSFRRYASNWYVFVEGITFWDQATGEQIINYPKQHRENGSAKNQRANNWYKPAVRIFKNARERIIGPSEQLRKDYPSYFVECLIYNVDDSSFGTSCSDTFYKAIGSLTGSFVAGSAQNFVTQNEQAPLFGTSQTQWSLVNGQRFVSALLDLAVKG